MSNLLNYDHIVQKKYAGIDTGKIDRGGIHIHEGDTVIVEECSCGVIHYDIPNTAFLIVYSNGDSSLLCDTAVSLLRVVRGE